MYRHALALFACLSLALPAAADQRNFTHTYDWFTPSRGEREIEAYWTQSNGGIIEPEVEFEYGVTDRWTIAPYVLFGREHGAETSVRGWRLEQRYRLGDYGPRRFLPALYFEVSKENGSPLELEGKLITSYLFGNGYAWSTNLILAGLVSGSRGTEVSYATGIAHPIGSRWLIGMELFGEWTPETGHFIAPNVAYRFSSNTQLMLSAGLRYRGRGDGTIRLLFEKEWN